MGRFSELDMLLKTIPIDREDSFFVTQRKSQNIEKNNHLNQISIWDFSDDELISFVSGKTPTEVYSTIVERIIAEKKSERPIVYQKNRG